MPKIFYSMCGEGRGHAARVRSMVERLRHTHELVLFAPDQAFEFLSPRYPDGTKNVSVRRIPGLRFYYTRGRLDLSKTLALAVGYLIKLPGLIAQLKRAIRQEQPDLVITDFEPALPRAARACGVPYVSLDHQHFLVACDLTRLPRRLQRWATMMGLAVRAHHSTQQSTIVSSFFAAPLKPGFEDVIQVGPLLRPELFDVKAELGDHLVSYFRSNTPPNVLEVLAQTGREVRLYGLGARKREGNLRFMPFDERTFIEDVATSSALIGAAGNQSLGEAIFLGKPVFALPEEKHHEQLINAHFLDDMGAGSWTTLEAVTPVSVNRFLGNLEEYRSRLQPFRGSIDGTSRALQEVGRFLPEAITT